MTATVVRSVAALLGYVGTRLGPTEAVVVDQRRIDLFAEATGDHQWIHVDADRAAGGPYGTTIAHGYLTLALAGTFVPQLLDVSGATSIVNYGIDRLRFLAPVPAGSSLSATAVLTEAKPIADGVRVTLDITVSAAGSSRPAAVVRSILQYRA